MAETFSMPSSFLKHLYFAKKLAHNHQPGPQQLTSSHQLDDQPEEPMIEWITNWAAWRLRKCLIFSTHAVLIFRGKHIWRFSLPAGVTSGNRKQTNTQINRLRVVIIRRLSLLLSQSLSAPISLALLSPPPEGTISKIGGIFVFKSGLRFLFWEPKVPEPRVRKRPLSLSKVFFHKILSFWNFGFLKYFMTCIQKSEVPPKIKKFQHGFQAHVIQCIANVNK